MKTHRTLPRIVLAGAGLFASLLPLAADIGTDPIRVDARLDRPVLYADQPGKVVVQIDLQPKVIVSGEKRAPVNLGLVLDRSGSMGGEKMRQAIEAARLAVAQLAPGDIVSVIIYDNEIDTLASAGKATREFRENIQRQLSQVKARGNTAIYGGLNQAAAELRKFGREGYVNRLILLSDGLANVGPSAPSDFERLARSFAAEDFIVSTIGLGLDFNEDVMTVLASAGQGNTYFVENSADLPRIFDRELGDVLSVAATEVEITVRSREGVRVIRGIGREAEVEDGRTARLRMPQIYGGVDKMALIELEVPAGAEGELRELVDIDVVYQPIDGSAPRRQELVVPVRYTAAKEEIVGAVEEDVVRNVALNRVAESKVQAIALADEGDREQAAEVLRETDDQLRRDYDLFGAADYASPVSAPLMEEAEEIESSGLSNRKRKEYRSSSYQTVNQQAETAD